MWASGLDFKVIPFEDEPIKYRYVQIEVEEILEYDSEGEEESEHEETVEKLSHKQITLEDLRLKVKKQPFGNALARGFS